MSFVISFQYQFWKFWFFFILTMELKRHWSSLYIHHWYLMQHCKGVSNFYLQYLWIFFNVGKSYVKSYVNQRCSHLKFRFFYNPGIWMLHVNHKKFHASTNSFHNHNSCVYDDWEFYMLFNFKGVGVDHELT